MVAVPAKVNGEWTGCWVLGGEGGGGGAGEPENMQPPEGGGGGIDWGTFLTNLNPPATGPDPIPGGGGGTWTVFTPPTYIPPADPYTFWEGTQGLEQSVADEYDPAASDSDPNNAWWDDNMSDPNVTYSAQPRPTFATMFNNYPKKSDGGDMSVPDVCNLIGGQIKTMFDNGIIANACALRVSRALNYSGVTIPIIATQTFQGADGKNYFIYAANLYNWLTKTFGQAEIHKTAAEGAPNGTKFQNQLIGMQNRGIYLMRPISVSAFQASGHATLWGGLDCIGGHNYFAAAKDIYIWKLPE